MELTRELRVGDYFYLNDNYEKYSLDLPAPCRVKDTRKKNMRTEYSFYGSGYFGVDDLWTPAHCLDIERTNKLIIVQNLKRKVVPVLPNL